MGVHQDYSTLLICCQLDHFAKIDWGYLNSLPQPPYPVFCEQCYKIMGIVREVMPNFKKFALTFVKLAQKCESPLFHWTCTKSLFPKYLLCRICCHIPSVVRRRYSHLLSRAMFWSSRLCIPSPPWSLGWHRILHFAKWYFLLCSSLCQKNLDRK